MQSQTFGNKRGTITSAIRQSPEVRCLLITSKLGQKIAPSGFEAVSPEPRYDRINLDKLLKSPSGTQN